MIWWVFLLVILSILSYLNDTGVLSVLQNVRIPFLHASLLSFLILVCAAGILIRMLWMRKRGEKEGLRERITRLEKDLAGGSK
jgi:spore maturation protein SpmA